MKRHGVWVTILLALVSVVATWDGLGYGGPSDVSSTGTRLYQSFKTLFLASPAVDQYKGDNLSLEIGRWTGLVVFCSGILGVASRLFSQSALTLFIWLFSRRHVVLAGLGKPHERNERLVDLLLQQGRSVVVVERSASHPSIEACEKLGAVVLCGSPFDIHMLRRACAQRAHSVLLVAENDHENLGLTYRIYDLLREKWSLIGALESRRNETTGEASNKTVAVVPQLEHPFRTKTDGQVGCVLGIVDPSLVNMIRADRVYTDAQDNLRLNVFCLREMVARAMLRETRILENPRPLGNILVVGLGEHHHMGEALVTRAAKDWFVDRNDREVTTSVRLVIDVLDENAETFVRNLTSRIDFIREHAFESVPNADEHADNCFLRAIPRTATRCGFRGEAMRSLLTHGMYDAIFVCLADEGQAVRHAIELRRLLDEQVDSRNVAVVVRVLQEESGFGRLLLTERDKKTGRMQPRPNLVPVGFRDRIQDVLLSLNPEVEMLAQVIHQQYLLTTDKLLLDAELAGNEQAMTTYRGKPARKTWRAVDEVYRQSNRDQAIRLARYVEEITNPNDSNARFCLEFVPDACLTPELGLGLPESEIWRLAELEHGEWVKAQLAAGWRLGGSKDHSDPEKKLSPYLVPWDVLDEGTKKYDYDVINRIAITFAKADYRLTPVQAPPTGTR